MDEDIERVLVAEAACFAEMEQTFLSQIENFTVDPFRRAYRDYAKTLTRGDEDDGNSVPPGTLHPTVARGLTTLHKAFPPLRASLAAEPFSDLIESTIDEVGRVLLDEVLSDNFTLSERTARQLRFNIERGVLDSFLSIVPDAAGRLASILEVCAIVTLPEAEWVRATNAKDDSAFLSVLSNDCLGGKTIAHLDIASARRVLDLRLDLKFKHDAS